MSALDIVYFYFSFCMLTILSIRDHVLAILYFRFCVHISVCTVCLQCRASDNLVLQILFASTSQFANSQFRAPDFVCFYFSICKLTISSSRFCVLLLLNLQAHNFELQKSRAYNLVVNILYASTSQFVHLILALITHHTKMILRFTHTG